MKKLLAVLVLGVSMISCSTPDAPTEVKPEEIKEISNVITTSTTIEESATYFKLLPDGTKRYIKVQKYAPASTRFYIYRYTTTQPITPQYGPNYVINQTKQVITYSDGSTSTGFVYRTSSESIVFAALEKTDKNGVLTIVTNDTDSIGWQKE